ncbi:MAG TPA: TlpA disulfide reductase family protein [Blastocatellia bacterium]|nr:TlpA disulfide reductase family protein [Blastocatellia bacterium]
MKVRSLLFAAMAFAILSFPVVAQSPTPSGGGLKPMLDLKLQDLSGKPVDAAQALKGKVLVVDFWATWCVPCIHEIPDLNKLQDEFASRGVEVLGVTMASGSPDEIKPYVEKFKMKYNVVMGDDDQTYDLSIVAYPTTFVVTRDWKIYQVYEGTGPGKVNRLQADLEKLVGRVASKG